MKQIKTVIAYVETAFDNKVNYYIRRGYTLVKREVIKEYSSTNDTDYLVFYAELERDKICKA